MGYEFRFEGERTHVRQVNVADVDDLAARLPINQRIRAVLGRSGALTVAQLAEHLEVPERTLRRTVERGMGKTYTRVSAPDGGPYRLALLQGGRS